jgi:hypothetical protein
MNPKEIKCEGLDWIDLTQPGNEPFISVKGKEFLGNLNDF